jgi:hypothetical protein
MKYFLLALQYLPFVLQGVQAVEGTLAGTKGADKKLVVLAAVTAAAHVGESVPEDHVKLVSGLIDNVVSLLNANGAFRTKGK